MRSPITASSFLAGMRQANLTDGENDLLGAVLLRKNRHMRSIYRLNTFNRMPNVTAIVSQNIINPPVTINSNSLLWLECSTRRIGGQYLREWFKNCLRILKEDIFFLTNTLK